MYQEGKHAFLTDIFFLVHRYFFWFSGHYSAYEKGRDYRKEYEYQKTGKNPGNGWPGDGGRIFRRDYTNHFY